MARRSGLGRGLGALLGDDVTEDSSSDAVSLQEIDIDRIQPNADQPRRDFPEDELTELAESIRLNGILQPIVVRPYGGAYQIVAGERRWQAARRAGLTQVSAVVREISDADVLKLALIENLQRQDLNPLEEARGYKALIEQNGLTQLQVAEVLSKSRSAITNALRLLDLPEEVQQMVWEGVISAGHGRAVLAAEGDEARIELARRVASEHLSVRQTESLASQLSVKATKPDRPKVARPESFRQAARTLGDQLGAKVNVRTMRGHNRIEIEFGDESELEALVARILASGEQQEG